MPRNGRGWDLMEMQQTRSRAGQSSVSLTPAMLRRRQAASFLLLDSSDHMEAEVLTDPGLGGLGGDAVAPTGKHLATSFSGHGTGTGAVAGDLHQIVADPYKIADSAMWAKLMTDVAVAANFGALILTFLGAAYHAYGYVQLRNAQKQASRSQGGGQVSMRFWRKKKGKKEHGKLANWLSTSLWWVEADNVVCLTSHFFKKHLGTSHLKPRMAAAPDPRQTDLHAFYGYVHFEPDWTRYGTFTRVRKIAKAIHGVVDSYAWRRSGADQERKTAVGRCGGIDLTPFALM
eukprot:g2344.t1